MGQAVTTNPVIIMLINMTIVFGVLILLALMIELIHALDPTKAKPKAAAAPKKAASAAAPAAAPAAPQADQTAVIAVIAAAIAACGEDVKIVTIRPAESTTWKNNGRAIGVQGLR